MIKVWYGVIIRCLVLLVNELSKLLSLLGYMLAKYQVEGADTVAFVCTLDRSKCALGGLNKFGTERTIMKDDDDEAKAQKHCIGID